MYAKPRAFADREVLNPRAKRSRQRVERAFRDLIAKKPFAQLSVAELAEDAGLARSTVYRRWAGLEQLVWEMMRPSFERAIKAALSGNLSRGADELATLWLFPGLIESLATQSALCAVRKHLTEIIAAEVERRCGLSAADTRAFLVSSSILAFMVEHPDHKLLKRPQLEELVYILYVTTLMTPAALQAAVRDRAEMASAGRFPPAVSVRESLASDEYIVSMIDGRPYRSLTRHLGRYGMSPDDYRRCFNLPADYPVVAKSYSMRRSELAHALVSKRRAAGDMRKSGEHDLGAAA